MEARSPRYLVSSECVNLGQERTGELLRRAGRGQFPQYCWDDLDQVRLFATQWLYNYNHHRPNMALGGITLMQRLAMAA